MGNENYAMEKFKPKSCSCRCRAPSQSLKEQIFVLSADYNRRNHFTFTLLHSFAINNLSIF